MIAFPRSFRPDLESGVFFRKFPFSASPSITHLLAASGAIHSLKLIASSLPPDQLGLRWIHRLGARLSVHSFPYAGRGDFSLRQNSTHASKNEMQ